MNKIWLVIFVLASVWLQVYFLGALRPFGVVPNTMLITVVLIAAVATASESIGAAIIGGFLLDSVSGTDFGLRTAFFSLVALGVVSSSRAGIDFGKLPQLLGVVLLGTLTYNLAVLANLVLLRVPTPAGHVLAAICAELVLNSVILILARPIVSRVLTKTANIPVINRPTGAIR